MTPKTVNKMNLKANQSEDIKRVLLEISIENKVKWSDFTLRMMDTIIADKESATTVEQLKRKWRSHFTTHLNQLNLIDNKGDDNWHIIENKIANIQSAVTLQDLTNSASSSKTNTADTISESSSITKSSRSRSNSSSTTKSSNSSSQLNETVTSKEKEEILNLYKNMKEEKMWRLKSGKIVEKEMAKLVENSHYEHPAHSFILDPEDENWLEYFTSEELDEIRSHKSRGLPTLPSELIDFFNSIKQSDINEMHKKISNTYYHPTKDYICHWAKKCLLEGIELFMTDFFTNENLTERDFLSRVWRLILLTFDQGDIKIREEIYSKATNKQINKKRKLSCGASIERKVISKRSDQLMKFGDYELGTVEGSKIDDEYSTKYFLDSMKKAPKTIKDMILQIMKAVPQKKHEVRTIGIITSKLEIDLLIMDVPENYVFRVQRTETFKYPCTFNMFIKEIRNCLEVVWMARMILEETVGCLTSPTPHVPITLKQRQPNDLLPTFYKKNSK